MGGFELKLWRNGLGWSQERAAEELGVSRRTYLTWEQKGTSRVVELATQALSIKAEWPETAKKLNRLSTLAKH
ncbi:transcriptional regulator [Klebsiella phage LASTA]|jgi:DNA-binding XRE family transcriptional regulator|uniref:Transcriptional regulator n=3 Tax=Lastavirus TaxID=2843414 RepID=A0A6H0X3G7_9CAUD|nr:transcriptional regulator [Klebsiella phage LASTA]YP_010078921.1 transcriptional regulator [Klebsiella phage SopranoGao]ASV45053.1 transcriptional regulator [Klebsiella phage SopranoGao]QIW86652.1 transcriptional regulator [Klebsiella phage LASTA]QIW86728.1 transcriptional regulator [Klebsiella phage SJM3]